MNSEKKAGHTPGPWRLEKYTDRLRVQNTAGVNVAEVIDQNAGPLLAAAPDLLAALEKCVHILSTDRTYAEGLKGGPVSELLAARAAIAKAKGE